MRTSAWRARQGHDHEPRERTELPAEDEAGWALVANSPAALYGGVGCFAAAIFSYHKLIEERELEERFGELYTRYKSTTPFLLPIARRVRRD